MRASFAAGATCAFELAGRLVELEVARSASVSYRERYRIFMRVATAIAVEEARGAEGCRTRFVRAITSRAAFRGDGTLEAWVWRIVVNAARVTHTRIQQMAGRAVQSYVAGSHGSVRHY
jgi:hypothetical protein